MANELTVWKVIVQYAYRQNGMDHKNCPLLKFPPWPHRIAIKVLADEAGRQGASDDDLSSSSDDDTPPTDDDAENSAQKTIRTRTSAVHLRREQYRSLCATVQSLLPTIRFASDHSKLKKLYLASAHGFSAEAFHERCDDQGPTLTIASTDKNVFIGGFNGMSWASDWSWRSAETNFIFQYAEEMAPVIFVKSVDALVTLNHPGHGPIFGRGKELFITGVS
ncbi:Interferon-induced protein 44-like [Actinomortierella ambigua]|nr:Interferon-induced protein 44-like [Actinomortierella ambigua]